MKMETALKEMFSSSAYSEAAKTESNLRVYLRRYRNGELKEASAQRLLLRFGYVISYTKK